MYHGSAVMNEVEPNLVLVKQLFNQDYYMYLVVEVVGGCLVM
jgi:hypothetical protein